MKNRFSSYILTFGCLGLMSLASAPQAQANEAAQTQQQLERKARAQKYLLEKFGPMLEAAKSQNVRRNLLSREYMLDGRERIDLSDAAKLDFYKIWFSKSRNRELREELAVRMGGLYSDPATFSDLVDFAEELTNADLPAVSAKPLPLFTGNLFPAPTNLTGYTLLRRLLEHNADDPKLQSLLGRWLGKMSAVENEDFYRKLSPENQRSAYNRLLLVMKSEPDANLPTPEFLQLCSLATATQPQLSIEQAIHRLDALRRDDLGTIENASLADVALAFGSLKAQGSSAVAAIPALLRVVAPKSTDYRLGDDLPEKRAEKVRERLRAFRYGAIQCLNEINLNQHPESLGAILDIFQRQQRIGDYSETSSLKAEIQLLKTAFSQLNGSNPLVIPEIVRGLKFEFYDRLYLQKNRTNKASWQTLHDPFITAQLFNIAARYKSQAGAVVSYAFLFIERGGHLVLPTEAETEYTEAAVTRFLVAAQLSEPVATKRLFSALERVSNQKTAKKSREQTYSDGEYQIVLLRILSQSPQNHPAFMKPPFREILLGGLNGRNPLLRAACAMVVAQLGENGAIFVPALVNSLKLRNEADYLMDEQFHNNILYSDMLAPGRSLMTGHTGKDGRTNATLETMRALRAVGSKAVPAIPVLQLITTEKSLNSNTPWRVEANETLRKIKNSS